MTSGGHLGSRPGLRHTSAPAAGRPTPGAIFQLSGQPLRGRGGAWCSAGTLLSLHARSAVRLVVLLSGGAGAGLVLEQTLKRRSGGRPSPAPLVHAFPLGHVTMWAVFLGTVAVCLGIGRSQGRKLALGNPWRPKA